MCSNNNDPQIHIDCTCSIYWEEKTNTNWKKFKPLIFYKQPVAGKSWKLISLAYMQRVIERFFICVKKISIFHDRYICSCIFSSVSEISSVLARGRSREFPSQSALSRFESFRCWGVLFWFSSRKNPLTNFLWKNIFNLLRSRIEESSIKRQRKWKSKILL